MMNSIILGKSLGQVMAGWRGTLRRVLLALAIAAVPAVDGFASQAEGEIAGLLRDALSAVESNDQELIGRSLDRLYSSLAETKRLNGLEKICGVWEMTVHNMLNHKEYRYILQVPPSGNSPRPSDIIVIGHTVYIRWDFPGGYSEESLLLRRDGEQMEGTFLNFAGARGGVSGKKVRSCESEP